MNESLELLFKQISRYVFPAKEPTLFEIGGRGYYENPTSDLLAFFLKPDAAHGLKDLFLSAFLECLQVQEKPNFSYIKIDREVKTEDGSRIDLQIQGQDWCLLIENKIYHWQANPFSSYAAHAERLRKKTKLYAILSPDGISHANGWCGVSYKDYCQKLRERLARTSFDSPTSKWQIFAREFVLHLENELELHKSQMTPEQLDLVEKNADQIAHVQKLLAQYREFIQRELKHRLEESIPGNTFDIREVWWPGHVFVFLCTSPKWSQNDMGLFKAEGTEQKFFVRVCLEDMVEPRLSSFREALNYMNHGVDGHYPYWVSPTGYESCREGIDQLCKLAQIVDGLLNCNGKTPKDSLTESAHQ